MATSLQSYFCFISALELISHPVDVTDLYAGDTARFECLAQGQGPLEYV